MSYDRQIDQVCPHIVVDEGIFVARGDRRTVRPLKPIASVDSVKVRLNGALDIPAYGVQVPGQGSGTRNGPFNIVADDVMVVSVDQKPDQVLRVPASKQLPANRLVDILNTQARGVQFSVVDNRIAFRTANTGPSASVFIRGTSTLAPTLGITANREYRGKDISSGWTLVTDPLTLSDRPTRLIVFDDPVKDFNAFVEITYNTARQDCRRCAGTGVENDWRYGHTGEVVQVRDEALLIQETQKLMYTVRGTNPFHIWYGTTIIEAIGRKLTAGGVVQNMILSDIYQAFRRWQSVKRQQEEAVGQTLTDEEYPYRLVAVTLNQSASDPTVIFVNITVQNRSQKPIQLTRGLKVPEPIDLLGSTAQQGVIRQSLSNFVLTG